ncbi:SCP-2 sterol transfer family protein [Acidihalobacter ferrooxydans]|uniref:SCP-2 sterol transfer family protein n=1 Tax=Acidihalobacter ferrooxydans TaxID=1765967 RepID=A0A1P8UH58_9GAMM|nr:SCP-2 sterol transfer family protein [Acidihalobacter ferrooxydans]APZ43183.1 SCP-2 sterol transfer family protein [Acidihalobacter ferrooxydans]
MSELFSPDWMNRFAEEWNKEPDLSDALAKIDFGSTIGYGFPDDAEPKGVLVVENGKATTAGPYDGQTLSWDIRATAGQWEKWMKKPPGMTGLGLAFTTGKIKFKVGDYGSMLKDPRMAGPFIKSFSVMGRV